MKLMKKIKLWAVPVGCGLAIFLLMRFVFFMGYVPTASMEPTIAENSYIFGCRIYGGLQQGDISVFQKDGDILVKRIAAVPGQTVYINDETLEVSVDEYLQTATRILTVPEDSYFMLGDNRDNSIDSRYWEELFVSREDILAVLIYE